MVSASHPPRAFNMPLIRTPLVGRVRESAEVRRLLSLPNVPLLTLTGSGGVGKTRLALQAATDLCERYRDGVCFVSLAPLRDPALVTSTIAEALGLIERDERAPEERIRRHLQQTQMLLVLDNFEHLLPAALVVADLLSSCPELQILVTSRTPLRISFEHEFAVPPLALPDRLARSTIAELVGTDAVNLFVQRAAAIDPGFDLTVANADDVAEICAQLDGLPLAIELAAARTRLLSPAALRARLANRLALLTDGPRDQPPRLRSMRDAVAWSYDLLGPAEKSLYRRLAIFAGGFTLEAAEAIAEIWQPSTRAAAAEVQATDRSGITQRSILDDLSSLLDANLVGTRAGDDGEPRFVMPETVREFGLELLSAHDETSDTNRCHAAWFLTLAGRSEPFLYGHRHQRRYLDLLEAEHNNLRAALAWLTDSGAHEEALRLSAFLLRYWYTRGHLSEGRAWVERTLAAAPDAEPALKAKALLGLAALSWPQDDRTRARAAHKAALALVEGTDDREGLALARLCQAFMAFDDGDFVLAEQAAREGKALYLELGRPWDAGMNTVCLIKTAHVQGDLERAEALSAENMAVFKEIGDEFGLATTLFTLGLIRMDQGGPRGALKLAIDAANRYQALGERV
jgi:non-specific serine/threonine protein kinase